jgi:hypothetical protein
MNTYKRIRRAKTAVIAVKEISTIPVQGKSGFWEKVELTNKYFN